MGQVIVRIPHIDWRGGRPRFQPGPKLRKLGFKGRDLRHGPTGPWFTLPEAEAESRRLQSEIAAARGAPLTAPAIVQPRRHPGSFTLADLFDEIEAHPRFGSKRAKISDKTKAWYRENIRYLRVDEPKLFACELVAFQKPDLVGLADRIEKRRGLAQARAIMATVGRAFDYAERRGRIRGNPAVRLGLAVPEERVRAGTIEEMTRLIMAADAVGRPEAGDAILLGLMTGQRQGDRLQLVDDGLRDGLVQLRQAKTGAVVRVPAHPVLSWRLAAAKRRRQAMDPQPISRNIVIDERRRIPFPEQYYSKHVFAAVRAAAVAGIEGVVEPTPSLADFQDRDLRDTAVTWLSRAGCTPQQICRITGHTEASVARILKHYLGYTDDMAEVAIARLTAWLQGTTIAAMAPADQEASG